MIRYTQWLMWLVVLLATPLAHAGTKHYYYTDPQGTPLAKADASGNITARFEYTPYGVPVASMGAAPDGVGYTGHVNDPETGLVYMQARYYDAEVGRFLSTDPVGPSPGELFHFNRYDYTNNNPINHTDPDGRCPVCIPLIPPAVTAAADAVAFVASAAAVAWAGHKAVNVYNEKAKDPSQAAVDKIKEGTKPADGQPGKDGVLVGLGGAAGADAAVETAKDADGSKVLVDNEKTTVVQLPDGRKVESHTSTRGGQYKGDRTVKIQDKDGKVRPENIIRYPEPKTQ